MELTRKEIGINFEGFKNKEKKNETSTDLNKTEQPNEGNGNGNKTNDDQSKTDAKKEKIEKCWFNENRKCKFGKECKKKHTEQCTQWIENGKCTDSMCKLAHPKICIPYYNKGTCARHNCWFIHPSKVVINNTNRTPVYNNTGYKQHRIQNAQGSHISHINNSQNFSQNYQTLENTMSIQQTLSRIMGQLEQMNSRVGYIEMRQPNNGNY